MQQAAVVDEQRLAALQADAHERGLALPFDVGREARQKERRLAVAALLHQPGSVVEEMAARPAGDEGRAARLLETGVRVALEVTELDAPQARDLRGAEVLAEVGGVDEQDRAILGILLDAV